MASSSGLVVWGKSGETLLFTPEEDTTVELARFAALDELREKLQMSTDIATTAIDGKKLVILDQLGNQPPPQSLLSSHKALFIFVRPARDLPNSHPDTLPPDFYAQHVTQLQPPDIPSASYTANSTSLLQSMRDHTFSRTERCRTYAQLAKSRADFCTQSSLSLQLQYKARDAVCAHIGQLSSKATEAHTELRERIDRHGRNFTHLLSSFEEDTKRLALVPLHPSLRGEHGETLADAVCDIVPWKELCHEKWQGLLAKLQDFEGDLFRVKREVEEVNNALPSGEVDFERLDDAGKEARETRNDLRVLQKEAEECLSNINDIAGDKTDEVSRLQQRIKSEELRERALFEKLKAGEEFCRMCSESRQHIQSFMKHHVERAVNLTSDVIRLQRRITSYAAALDGVAVYFNQLEIMHFMPEAYRWGVVELHRRIHYHRKVACVVTTAQQLLAKFNSEEEGARKEWNDSLGPYIPEGILDALSHPLLSLMVESSGTEVSYPALENDTPEHTIRFYDALELKAPSDTPLPPKALVSLHSAPLEQELDVLVSSFSKALEQPGAAAERPQVWIFWFCRVILV